MIEELKQIADDLRLGIPHLEVLHVDEVPGFPKPKHTGAFVLRNSLPVVKSFLKERDRWKGFWPPVIVFVQEPSVPILLHECAHLLCDRLSPLKRRRIESHEATEGELNSQGELFDAWKNQTSELPVQPGWGGHGAEFIRIALHIHWRACQFGLEPFLSEMRISGAEFNTSASWKYRRALDSEPERLAHMSFSEILATKPPAEFGQLWNSDRIPWVIKTFNERQA